MGVVSAELAGGGCSEDGQIRCYFLLAFGAEFNNIFLSFPKPSFGLSIGILQFPDFIPQHQILVIDMFPIPKNGFLVVVVCS